MNDDWSGLGKPPSFAVVGLGGAGSETVADLIELGLGRVRPFCINTDARHLVALRVDERILIGHRQLRGRGSGGDRARVLQAAEESREELLRRLAEAEVAVLVAGLGGGTGSALLPWLVRALRSREVLTVPVVFLPFHIELDTNPVRQENVARALEELEALGGLLVVLANEKLRRFRGVPIHRVFRVRSSYVHSLVMSLHDMIESPSDLNVDLASLKGHLADAGLSTVLFGECHVAEPDRLVAQAWTETLLDFDLTNDASALVHLDAGENLTLDAVDTVLRTLSQKLRSPKRLVFGTRIRPERREVVRLTAVLGGVKPRRSAREFAPAGEPFPLSVRPVGVGRSSSPR